MPLDTKQHLIGRAKTAGYRSVPHHAFNTVRNLPTFSHRFVLQMLYDPTIRLGLAMRSAPLSQAEFGYTDGGQWIEGIRADKPEVGEFVYEQIRRLWQFDLHKVLTAQVWGWSAGEVQYRLANGRVEFDSILHRHAMDVFALQEGGETKAVRFKGIGSGSVVLHFPKAFWHSYSPEAESPYGRSILLGAFSPWCDKWLDGGGLDVRRLFMHKDAYGGVDLSYPPGTTMVGDQEIPNRDIARQIVEQIKAGGVTTRPAEFDQAGKSLWELTRASLPGNAQHILDYPKDLDTEILRGLEIPDDVIKSDVGGAWQGKQVPMQAFYTSADRWLAQVVQVVTTQILEPLVRLNWGRDEEFEVETKPLAQQVMEQIEGDPGPEDAAQQSPSFLQQRLQQNTQSMSLERQRLASECGATGGPRGGFRLENTCWKLTKRQKEALAKRGADADSRQKQQDDDERERILMQKFDELGRDLEEEERQVLETEHAANVAKRQKRADANFKRTKMYQDISETLDTTDMQEIKGFRELMKELHKPIRDAAAEFNDVYDELIDQLVAIDPDGRSNRGGFISGLRRAADPTKVPKFDELVQYVRDNPATQQVMQANAGESTGKADLESLVFEGLRAGKKEIPGVNSDEVWEQAITYLDRYASGSDDAAESTEDDAQRFSLVDDATDAERMVGAGIIKAADMVSAAREYLRQRAQAS